MNEARQSWLVIAFSGGVLYAVIGLTFAALAGSAASPQLRVTWRLTAWVLSAVVFAAHVWYERVRRSNAPRTTAWHVCTAVALGGFGLALAASIHNGRVLALALVVWPLLLSVPAYVVALLAAAALKVVTRQTDNDSPERAA
jgi:predicted Na+-dependent transporter